MARRRPAQVHGLLVLDKPRGCTSHDVVDRVRRALGERKVGHSGTLDPDATGVLLVGVGRATRLLRFLDVVHIDGHTTTRKVYRGSVVLGTETDSLDSTGRLVATHDMGEVISSVTVAGLQALVDAHFRGVIEQIPPMVSAIRVDGRRMHELARAGIEMERQPRHVSIHDIRILGVTGNVIDIEVACSSGTFIRTLAADIGRALGGGAHLRDLRRLAVGSFSVDEAITLEDLESVGQERARLMMLPVVACVRGLSSLRADPDLQDAVAKGSVLRAAVFSGPPPWAVVRSGSTGDTDLLAVYEPFANDRVGADMARPVVVLTTSDD